MAISQSVLREKARQYAAFESVACQNVAEGVGGRRKTAFLCHSHKDEALVKGLIRLFKDAGVDLYVDWADHTMPDSPNKETAENIQKRIETSDIFLFLATANSKASRWCPWEIGFTDSKGKGVYIIPTKDSCRNYGNEYLELYPNIDAGTYQKNGKPGYFVTLPGVANGYAISNDNLT